MVAPHPAPSPRRRSPHEDGSSRGEGNICGWLSFTTPIRVTSSCCPVSMEDVKKSQHVAANDPLLRDLVEARDEAERRDAIERAIAEAKPVIASVLARNRSGAFRRDDFDDVASTVMMRLVRRLQLVPSDVSFAIANLKEFTAR